MGKAVQIVPVLDRSLIPVPVPVLVLVLVPVPVPRQ